MKIINRDNKKIVEIDKNFLLNDDYKDLVKKGAGIIEIMETQLNFVYHREEMKPGKIRSKEDWDNYNKRLYEDKQNMTKPVMNILANYVEQVNKLKLENEAMKIALKENNIVIGGK